MGNSLFINTVPWNIHIHCLYTVYGCIHSTVADLSSKPSTLPSKSGHTTSSGGLFLRLPPPLIPVIFIVTCQPFRSCHIRILIITYFYVQYYLPHQMTKSLGAWDHVSGHKYKVTALQMLIYSVDNHDGTFQMFLEGLKESVLLLKVQALNSGRNFHEKVH